MVATVPESAETLHAGELEIRPGDGLVLAAGRALTLSVREFALLVAMTRRSGAIVTRAELFGAVWGGELRPGDRSVDVYVSKLRGKLESAMPGMRFIHTHPGFGYRFQPEPTRPPIAEPTRQPIAEPTRQPIAHGSREPTAACSPDGLSRNVHISGPGA
jgi:DNA-binding winged helix-turn-helix (wHTH) protein